MKEEPVDFTPENVEPSSRNLFLKVTIGVILSLIFVSLVAATYIITSNQPVAFSEPRSVHINEGDSVPVITEKLEAAGIVKSSEFLYLVLVLFYDPTQIKASQYVFEAPLTTTAVAERLIQGDFATNLTAITVFEGESREKIANRIKTNTPWFDETEFLALSEGLEGKLFPDTYFIPTEFTTQDFVTLLNDTYDNVIADLQAAITDSPYTEDEIVTLASIVEREANTKDSMRMVAGIFLNRLAIGMPLQADASIEYVLEHEINDLRPGQLADSLREVDSPYNTYLYSGLPPTPIGNPGLDAIEAVLNATQSDFLYYITGDDGNFYYSETYDEHLINIEKYLK